ncbi:MAG: HEAT repeat domain-containing protein, partial [Planctomycetota bacterium]
INLVSAEPWGLKEPYLEKYAEIAQTDPAPACRGAAVRALGRAGEPRYVPVLVAALDDDAASVRWDAAGALGELTSPSAAAALCRRAVGDESPDVRAACAKSLGNYGGPDVRDTLINCLLDEEFAVRYQARQSLTALTGFDGGYDPQQWRDLAARDRPATRPGKRPWWDWAGLTDDDEPADDRPGEPRYLTDVLDDERAAAGAEAPDTDREQDERPWWDWMGVTAEDTPSDAPAEPSAPDDAAPPKPGPLRVEDRPWWDWMGVTGDQEAPEVREPD